MWEGWGGEHGGLNFPLPIPFNPVPTLFLLAPASVCFFRSQNCTMLCTFPISPASRHLGNPTSCPLYSHLLYTSPPLFSRVPPPLYPSTIMIVNVTSSGWRWRVEGCYMWVTGSSGRSQVVKHRLHVPDKQCVCFTTVNTMSQVVGHR